MNPYTYERKLIKPDGSLEDYPPAGKHYTLEELQQAVGGYIEILHVEKGFLMVVNEQGKLKDLPVNRLASLLYGNPFDHVVGNALVCRSQDID